jgi:hypothetical protein
LGLQAKRCPAGAKLEERVSCAPGREYAVHASEDFATWRHVHTLIADGNTASFTDGEVVPAGCRFYKIEVLPLP